MWHTLLEIDCNDVVCDVPITVILQDSKHDLVIRCANDVVWMFGRSDVPNWSDASPLRASDPAGRNAINGDKSQAKPKHRTQKMTHSTATTGTVELQT